MEKLLYPGVQEQIERIWEKLSYIKDNPEKYLSFAVKDAIHDLEILTPLAADIGLINVKYKQEWQCLNCDKINKIYITENSKQTDSVSCKKCGMLYFLDDVVNLDFIHPIMTCKKCHKIILHDHEKYCDK